MKLQNAFGLGLLLLASTAYAAETEWTLERLVLGSPWDRFPVGTAIVFEVHQPGMTQPGTIVQVLTRTKKGGLEVVAKIGQATRREPVVTTRDAKIVDLGSDTVTIEGKAMPCSRKRVTFAGTAMEVCLHDEHGVLRIDKESYPSTTVVKLAEPCTIGDDIQLTCRRLSVGRATMLMSLDIPSAVVFTEQPSADLVSTMQAIDVKFGQPDLCGPLRKVADRFLEEKAARTSIDLVLEGASRSYLETRTREDGKNTERFVAEFHSYGPVGPARGRYEQAFAALRACSEFSWTDEKTVDDRCRILEGHRGQAEGPVELRVETCFRSTGESAFEQVVQVTLE